jgi:hypothetical protein
MSPPSIVPELQPRAPQLVSNNTPVIGSALKRGRMSRSTIGPAQGRSESRYLPNPLASHRQQGR